MARRLKCPMCGAIFVCNRRVECWCVRIRVSAQKLEAIRRVSDDCVCARCLKG